MEPWRTSARGRRRAVFAFALLAHVALIIVMSKARLSHDRPDESRAVEATILLASPRVREAVAPSPAPRPTKLRSIPHAAAEPRAIAAPVLVPQPVAQAASAPEPPASVPLPPLNLTLTRDQLRAVIAGTRPTLGQSLARGPAPSPLERIGGDDAYSEKALPGGETEVHSHGGCFKMVPTPASRYDPFNHGGALPGNCN